MKEEMKFISAAKLAEDTVVPKCIFSVSFCSDNTYKVLFLIPISVQKNVLFYS